MPQKYCKGIKATYPIHGWEIPNLQYLTKKINNTMQAKITSKVSNPDKTIWRYMDALKFISLLQKRSLFFTSADILATTDPFEGLLIEGSKIFYDIALDRKAAEVRGEQFSSEVAANAIQKFNEVNNKATIQRKDIFVNCWHHSDKESFAMWKIYASLEGGVAIKSTPAKLALALSQEKRFPVLIQDVKYHTDDIDSLEWEAAYFRKLEPFKYEQEVRALVSFAPDRCKENDYTQQRLEAWQYNGVYADVDLNSLIENVIISPACGSWVSDAIQLSLDQWLKGKRVSRSELYRG